MLAQVVYDTNADLDASHDSMAKNPLVVADKTEKGLLWFKFKESRTVFQLSPVGKLQVRWNDVSEKRMLFRFVKNLLVTKSKEKLQIKPLKQQTWIDYPVPEAFKLYWCDNATEFVLNKPSKNEPATAEDRPEKTDNPLRPVIDALEELRRQYRFFREPSKMEVALKSGVTNSYDLSFGLAFGHWKERPYWGDAEYTAKEAINLAGWLRFKESGELNPRLISLAKKALDKAPLEVLEKARLILKNCPDLIPQINGTELRWPEETKREWIKVFGTNPPDPQTWDT